MRTERGINIQAEREDGERERTERGINIEAQREDGETEGGRREG